MTSNCTWKRITSLVLVFLMVLGMAPVDAFAAEGTACGCESDDPSWHAPFCEAYVAPEDPQCLCVEKCAEGAANEWCDVCYFDAAACAASGEEEAAVYATAPTYISKIAVAYGAKESTPKDILKNNGFTIINYDLNDGCGATSHYIYLGYKTTTDPSQAITGIFFSTNEDKPNTATFDGVTANLLGGSGETNPGENTAVDLNSDAKGSYIYTYVTRDTSRAPLTEIVIDGISSKSGYVTPNVNLNQGTKGGSIYLHYKQFSATVSATYHYLNASGSRTSSTQSGTVKTHLEKMSKVPSYPTSVTYEGRSYTFKGWREDNTANTASTTAPYATYMTGTKTYRAVYQGNVTVSFNANGGSGAPAAAKGSHYINAGSSSVSKQSVSVTIPNGSSTHPTKCNFLGWAAGQSATSAAYQPGDSITVSGNTTLYAVYANHSYNDKGICTACSGLDHTCQYSANGFCPRCDGYETPALANGYYQITNGGNLFWFAKHINTVDRTANAKLTADINLENRPWTPIGFTGEDKNNFRGHFDGQGHTIKNLYAEGGRSGLGFFGEVRLGTVENFTIYGEVKLTGRHDYVGGVIGSAPGVNAKEPNHNGATIRNITSYVNVTLGEDSHGASRVGGFIGYANHETLIENCAWYGTLDLDIYRAQDGVGGLLGKANDDSAVTIRNCGAYGTIRTAYKSGSYDNFDTIFIGGIVSNSVASAKTVIENTLWAGKIVNETNLGTKAHIAAFGTLNGIGSVTNCYAWKGSAPYITTNGTQDSYITSVTTAQLASGEVAYKLGAAWGQTIGSNAYPILGGKKVYCGYTDCQATEKTYANVPLVETAGVHNYDKNGFCTVCDGFQSATGSGTESNPYKIGNAGQLYWFAAKVNDGDTDAWAELTADIVVNENVLKADGTLNGDGSNFHPWTPIGIDVNWYTGTFDGNDKTVSGLYVNKNTSFVGLFGWSLGTVKNVGVVDSYLSGNYYVGGVVGSNYGTVANCYNTGNVSGGAYVGGVVGENYDTVVGTVEYCYNTGTVSGSDDVISVNIGGVVGFNSGSVEDCYNTGAVSGIHQVGGVAGGSEDPVANCYNTGNVSGDSSVGGVVGSNYGPVVNCYYDSTVYSGNAIGFDNQTSTNNVEGKTTEQFKSGEVAYLLQGEQTQQVWGQNIDGTGDKDAYPVFSDAKVYQAKNCKGEISGYSNTDGKQLDHTYNDNGFCTVCDGFQSATGSGTKSDPYQIGNAGQLYWFATKVNDGDTDAWAVLTANITVNTGDVAGCNGTKAEGWKDWTPIGNSEIRYIGTFDGNGKTVSGLYFNKNTDNVGLFGRSGGTIKNVGVVDSYISGSYYVGGVVGSNSGTVESCYNAGSVSGGNYVSGVVGSNSRGTTTGCYNTGSVSGSYYVGGVVGENYGTVESCYNTGTISVSRGDYVGGVVGYNYRSIVANCYNAGTVSASQYVGGVVGRNTPDSTVVNSYNIGTVSGRNQIGGVAGSNDGTVESCHNTGIVSGSDSYVGGVVGNDSGGTITGCYNTGSVSGSYYVGGVVGSNYGTVESCYNAGSVSGGKHIGGVVGLSDATVANCYYDSTVYSGNAIGSGNGTATNVEGKTTEQFKSGEVAYLLQGEQTQQVWGQNIDGEGEKDAYPVFSDAKVYPAKNCDGSDGIYSNTQDVQKDHIYENGFCTFCEGYQPAPGDGTEGDPYQIGNAGQLYWFAAVVNDGYGGVAKDLSACAELTADITVNENVLTEDGTLNDEVSFFLPWTPIGETSDDQYIGTFDGKEYTVSGLYFNENINYVGLFGYVGMDGTVKNVGVVDSYLSGYEAVGGVVGQNDKGTITGCYNEGTVSGSGSNVGGVVGTSGYNSTVANCYNTGTVSGYRCVGGVVGSNYGTVESCHNTGIVSGDDGYVSDSGNNIGGVVGANLRGTITGCYNEGSVSGSGNNVGGVAGYIMGSVKNCYNTGNVSGKEYVGGVVGQNNGAVLSSYNSGDVSGKEYVGGVVGQNNSGVLNSYNSGSVGGSGSYIGGVVGENSAGVSVMNCYYDSTVYSGNAIGADEGTATNVEGKTTEQFKSGEVAYLLQGEQTQQVWGQNIDGEGEKDAYPVFSDAKVYPAMNCDGTDGAYSNTQDVQKDHIYSENGFCANFGCYQPATGSGTESNPYKIGNAGQLYWFAAAVNDGHTDAWAVLTANITVNTGDVAGCNGTKAEGWKDWTPIGKDIDTQYEGTFDGKGFTVSGLYFNKSDTNYVGLFGYSGGTVKNVGVVNSYLHGNERVSGVVGFNNYGNMEDCYNTGTVIGVYEVGGVTSCNIYGTVTNCYNEGTVSGSYAYVGGVAGYNYGGTVINCYNEGTVSSSCDYVGGVAGYNDFGTVTNCYNEGSVSGSAFTGGVVGPNYGPVVNSYNIGSVSGDTAFVGGVVGENYGPVVNSYNIGSVSGNSKYVGGVVGDNSGPVVNCYYDSTVYTGNAIGSDSGTATDVVGKTTEQFTSGEVAYLLSQRCTVGEGEAAVTYPGDVWGQNIDGEGEKDAYPVFSDAKVYAAKNCANEIAGYSNTDGKQLDHTYNNNGFCTVCKGYQPATGSGIESDPYKIGNAGQLYWFAAAVNDGDPDAWAELTANITVNTGDVAGCNGTKAEGWKDWTPIGKGNRYTGTFDGKGFTVSGLYFNKSDTSYVGLFGFSDGTIKNIGVVNSYLHGFDYVGGVVGENDGTVESCYNTGTVSGSDYVSGVVGDNYGTVESCYNTGTVSGSYYVGGVVGENYGTVESCYNTGTVSGSDSIGGVVGNNYSTVENCYNEGAVSGSNYIGGLVGSSYSTVANCYNEGAVSGDNQIGGLVGNNYSTVANCYNTGIVSGSDYVGGVTGRNDDVVEGCYNTGSVSGSGNHVGGVVGYNSDTTSTVESCYNTGTVSGSNHIGGVAGSNGGTITSCYNTGTVSGSDHIGGVAGSNNGTITSCYNEGAVSGDDYIGGLVGNNYSTVANCYNTGSVSGSNYYVGGVVGSNYSTVENCYNIGSVSGYGSGYGHVGGVAGRNDGVVEGCYNTGSISGGSFTGGVVGSNYGTVVNCYYDRSIYNGNAFGFSMVSATDVLGKVTADFVSGHVAYLLSQGCTVGETVYSGEIWGQNIDGEGEKDAYPVFSDAKVYPAKNCDGSDGIYSNTQDVQKDHIYSENGFCTFCEGFQPATGDGTESDPYQIGNAGQLYWFTAAVNDGHTDAWAVLTDDIIVNIDVLAEDGTLNGDGSGFLPWTPIGETSRGKYIGTFDGKEYTVSGLYFNKSDTSYVGLFGYSGGTVKNVGVVDSYINGRECVGGIVGYNYGTITNCYNEGTVSGDFAGGVAGHNNKGTVESCYNAGLVSGFQRVGGLVGDNFGTIANCYTEGTASGSYFVGGVTGYNSYSTVVNSYNIGSVSGEGAVGGVVGENYEGTVANCYYDSTVYSGNAIGFDYETSTNNVEGKTTAEFASGAVTYSLSQGCTVGEGEAAVTYTGDAWGQKIDGDDKDAYPVFSDAKVYRAKNCKGEAVGYSNTDGKQLDHTYNDNGFCSLCGGCEPAVLKNDCYEISNAGQLYWFASQANRNTINGKLTDDIVVNEDVLNDDGTLNGDGSGFLVWTPIKSYHGTFDGDGHTISGLYFNNSGVDEVGLFGSSSGTVKNVGVVDSYISGLGYVGGVVGYNFRGTVVNCYNTGTVSGKDSIEGGCVGGVVGGNCGTIMNCYNTGNVSGFGNVGGVVGGNQSEGNILENCYNTGNISGSACVGGVMGCGFEIIATNCYNTGNVSGDSSIGGLVGESYNSSYTNCYYDSTVYRGSAIGYCNGYANVTDVEGKITADFASGHVAYLLSRGCTVGETVYSGEIWGQNIDGEGEKDAYPVFSDAKVYQVLNCKPEVVGYSNSKQEGTPDHTYDNGFCTVCDGFQSATGNGTESDPYKIGNAGQLYWFAAEVNGGDHDAWAELTADIVVNENVLKEDGTLNGDGSNFLPWTPINKDYYSKYTGTFDGDGHTISGLYFNNSGAIEVGLFGRSGGTVKNVGVVDSYLSGGFGVGGVVSYNEGGTVANCYNTGAVSGSQYVGGVAGTNEGTVESCYNTGTVSGEWYVGGVVGQNNGGVLNSYNSGDVSGKEYVGGVVSYNYGTVANCYNTGSVSGSSECVGGVAGYNCGTVENCYNTGSVSGSSECVGGVVGENISNHTVVNSYNTGSVSGSQYVGGVVGENYGTVVNCYYNSEIYIGNAIGYGKVTATDVLGKTTADFASGEVAYSLSQGCTVGETVYSGDVWGQNIDNGKEPQNYPVFSDAKVYFGFTDCGDDAAGYTNSTATETRPQHSQDLVYADLGDGTHSISCSACGQAVREPEAHSFTDYQDKDAEIGLGKRKEAACDQLCGAVDIRDEEEGTALVVRNMQTGQFYNGIDAALEATQAGQTLQLVDDVTWSGLLREVDLDLNGFVLSVDRYLVVFSDANILDNSASNSGLLLMEEAAKKYLVLPENNDQLPIYGSRMSAGDDKRVGYSFVEILQFNSAFREEEADFVFQPVLERSACDHLQNGAEISQVQVVVRVSWEGSDGQMRKQDFVYTDDLVRKFAASYNETKQGFKMMFTLKLNVENMADYGFQILVKSNTGVTIGTDLMHK